MKYFTPELIVRGQSSDDRIIDEVERLWDEAGDRYTAYMDSIRPSMPPGLRHIDDSYYLHDALVFSMGRKGSAFVIVLQLDTPPQSILTFTYELVGEPAIDKNALPPEHRFEGPTSLWQYDEIEMTPGDTSTWVHSILFGNGWEVTLPFRDVQVQELQAVLPAPRGKAMSQSA